MIKKNSLVAHSKRWPLHQQNLKLLLIPLANIFLRPRTVLAMSRMTHNAKSKILLPKSSFKLLLLLSQSLAFELLFKMKVYIDMRMLLVTSFPHDRSPPFFPLALWKSDAWAWMMRFNLTLDLEHSNLVWVEDDEYLPPSTPRGVRARLPPKSSFRQSILRRAGWEEPSVLSCDSFDSLTIPLPSCPCLTEQ